MVGFAPVVARCPRSMAGPEMISGVAAPKKGQMEAWAGRVSKSKWEQAC